ncbi:MAG: NAD(P)/FAD-dependent oxidoreductase [Gemmatimonas sp.]
MIDVGVIGGGPAGAATAIGLVRRGRGVLLFERSARPHDKVCGDFLSADSLAHLERLGVDPRAEGAVPVHTVALRNGRREAAAPLPFPAVSLSRRRLDAALLNRAARIGTDVRRGVSVRGLTPTPDGWRVYGDDDTAITCRRIVLATGKLPMRGVADARDRSMVGLKMRVRLTAPVARALAGRVELMPLAGGYVGLQPIERGTATVCALLPRGVVAGMPSGWPALADFLMASPAIAERLAGAIALWDKPLAVVCPNGGHVDDGDGHFYRVGDRLAHIPPLAGDGIGIALASAALAVDAITREWTAREYHAAARHLVAAPVRRAGALSWVMGRDWAPALAAWTPTLMRAAARATRVTSHGFQRLSSGRN